MNITTLLNLEESRKWLKEVTAHYNGDLSETDEIALHALDRAIKAEKRVVDLEKALRTERDYALTWDGISTAYRIEKALENEN